MYRFWRMALAAAVLAVVLAGCRKAEFKVTFELPPTVDANYTLLYYASDSRQGFICEQVALVQKGVCELTATTANATLVYLFQGAADPGALFYAERGDRIEIKGDAASPVGWQIGGNDVNDDLSAWRRTNRDAVSGRNAAKINAAVARYVEGHRDRAASALLLLVYYDRSIDEAGFSRLWKSLKGDAADEKWQMLVSRCDMAAGMAEATRKLSRIVLRTAHGYDTVDPARIRLLIYLANNGAEGRDAHIARLRKMASKADSASRMVVDVNMEMDSMAWSYQTGRDSLRGALRAWMPLGFSDSVALQLGIARIPLFIVAVPGGKIIYRGNDADKAAEAFSKQ